MTLLPILDLVTAIAGLVLAVIVYFRARIGPASWALSLSLLPISLLSAVLGLAGLLEWEDQRVIMLAAPLILLFALTGTIATYQLYRIDSADTLKKRMGFFAAIAVPAPIFAIALQFQGPLSITPTMDADTLVALGPLGYCAALYVLLMSVAAIANLEQTLRGAEEHVRWEAKFLLLGLALAFGAVIYLASQILLYRPQFAYVSMRTLRGIPIIHLCSLALIFQSWRRGSGRWQVRVSQSAIYSTITLLGIGGYLIATSLISKRISAWQQHGISAQPLIVLLSLALLSALFLTTAFRHRARVWLRRHLFAGKYDYRQAWIDATEQARSLELARVAAAFASLVQKALGSLDISIWVRVANTSGMRLIEARGEIADSLPQEMPNLAEQLEGVTEPIAVTALEQFPAHRLPPEFIAKAAASILAPLVSSGRLVGLLTVGPDRSGNSFDDETRDFLRVMASHFANEFHKAELLSTLVEAREAEAFRNFSTFLLHDLKNFASTLSLIANNGARYQGNPDFQADAFRSIFEVSEKMKRLCNSLRTFSTTIAANKAPADINEIVRSVAAGFGAQMQHRLQLELNDLPLIALDSEEISRVLRNLLLNAHEASPETGTIRVRTASDGSTITVAVADEGRGIAKEFLQKALFHPFQTTKSDGMGIGLFQSRKIVEAHNGVIEVDSVEGSGTVIRVLFRIPEKLQPLERELAHQS